MNQNIRPDNKGRISLGEMTQGISSYKMTVEENGRIILEPYVEIPYAERWRFKALTEITEPAHEKKEVPPNEVRVDL